MISSRCFESAARHSFFSRDNTEKFIQFCRRLGVHQHLLFESDDLGTYIRCYITIRSIDSRPLTVLLCCANTSTCFRFAQFCRINPGTLSCVWWKCLGWLRGLAWNHRAWCKWKKKSMPRKPWTITAVSKWKIRALPTSDIGLSCTLSGLIRRSEAMIRVVFPRIPLCRRVH